MVHGRFSRRPEANLARDSSLIVLANRWIRSEYSPPYSSPPVQAALPVRRESAIVVRTVVAGGGGGGRASRLLSYVTPFLGRFCILCKRAKRVTAMAPLCINHDPDSRCGLQKPNCPQPILDLERHRLHTRVHSQPTKDISSFGLLEESKPLGSS